MNTAQRKADMNYTDEALEAETAAKTRAGLLALASLHFNQRPDCELVEQTLDPAFADVLAAYARELGPNDEMGTGVTLMNRWIENNTGKDRGLLSDELGVDRTRLYRGIAPNYGPEAPYESIWMDIAGNASGYLLGIVELYRASGFAVATNAGERPDYIGIELEFCRMLEKREAKQAAAGDMEAAEATREEMRGFVRNHIGLWAPRFIASALGEAKTDFYTGHLLFTQGLLQAISSGRV